MPAADGLSHALQPQLRAAPARRRRGAAARARGARDAADLDGARHDARGRARCSRAGVSAIVVLGGDGTHRVVAKACGDVPICALSTGTNNVFPEMREATVAGLATGLVATGRGGEGALRREAALVVERDGRRARPRARRRRRHAASASSARARCGATTPCPSSSSTFADPGAVGLSAVAGLLEPVQRGAGRGLHVRLARDPATREVVLHVPLAPGLVDAGRRGRLRALGPGDTSRWTPGAARSRSTASARSSAAATTARPSAWPTGPLRIDVDAVMAQRRGRGATQMQPAAR